jgi:hypothetical protein
VIILVLTFLWIKRITLDGLHYAGKQWGHQAAGNGWNIYYPIVVNVVFSVICIDSGAQNGSLQYLGCNTQNKNNGFTVYSSHDADFGLSWLMLGA